VNALKKAVWSQLIPPSIVANYFSTQGPLTFPLTFIRTWQGSQRRVYFRVYFHNKARVLTAQNMADSELFVILGINGHYVQRLEVALVVVRVDLPR
jgi:hypothetical protein